MKTAMRALGGLLILAGGALPMSAGAQSSPAGDERAFVGATWSGGEDREIAGYESYGGSFVRGATAVSPFRSRSSPGDWIFVSKAEIGRDGDHARWRGLDTIRVSARSAESFVAYECLRASQATENAAPEPGLIGLLGEGSEDSGGIPLLSAEWAVRVADDGRFVAVNEPVVCVNDAQGI